MVDLQHLLPSKTFMGLLVPSKLMRCIYTPCRRRYLLRVMGQKFLQNFLLFFYFLVQGSLLSLLPHIHTLCLIKWQQVVQPFILSDNWKYVQNITKPNAYLLAPFLLLLPLLLSNPPHLGSGIKHFANEFHKWGMWLLVGWLNVPPV